MARIPPADADGKQAAAPFGALGIQMEREKVSRLYCPPVKKRCRSVLPSPGKHRTNQTTMSSMAAELITETFGYDAGRQVTVYRPASRPEAVVFAGDGQLISQWGGDLEAADVPPTMVVGVHRPADEMLRLHEYSPGFDPDRFAAHEKFFVDDVRRWVGSRFGVAPPRERTAVFGVSAGGELALAIGLRTPGRLRCGLLRVTRRRLPAACRDAEPASARLPRCRHAGAVFPQERHPVGRRIASRGCGRRARGVPADGGVGVSVSQWLKTANLARARNASPASSFVRRVSPPPGA